MFPYIWMMNLAMAYVYEAAGGSVSIPLAPYPVTYFVESLYRLQIIYGKKAVNRNEAAVSTRLIRGADRRRFFFPRSRYRQKRPKSKTD